MGMCNVRLHHVQKVIYKGSLYKTVMKSNMEISLLMYSKFLFSGQRELALDRRGDVQPNGDIQAVQDHPWYIFTHAHV